MRDKPKRLLFLCVQRSVRALLAASILSARVRGPWDIWVSNLHVSPQERDLACQVLDELGMVLIATPQTVDPSPGLLWEEVIILCSSVTAICPIIPGARRQRWWVTLDIPSASIDQEQRLLSYRGIRDTLRSLIDEELLLPTLHRRDNL